MSLLSMYLEFIELRAGKFLYVTNCRSDEIVDFTFDCVFQYFYIDVDRVLDCYTELRGHECITQAWWTTKTRGISWYAP